MRKVLGVGAGVAAVLTVTLILGACGSGSSSVGGCGSDCPPPAKLDYLYAAEVGTVQSFSINTQTGALSPTGSAPGPTQGSAGMVADPAGKFLFVSDLFGDAIDVFALGSGGSLSFVNAFACPSACEGNSSSTMHGLAINPQGTFLYSTQVTTFNGCCEANVVVWSVDSATGNLGALNGYNFAGFYSTQIAIDPTGSLLYTADTESDDGNIYAFTMDPNNGTLNGAGMFSTPGSAPVPIGLAIDPTGTYLYVAANVAGTVQAFTIDPASGALTLIPGQIATGGQPVLLAMDPAGNFLFAGNQTGGVAAFTIDSNSGVLSQVAGSPFGTSSPAWGLGLDGQYLYAADGKSSVVGYSVDVTTGALTALGQTVPAGQGPFPLTVVKTQ